MFIDEQTQNKIHADLNDTVIRATLRPQDLIPAFLGVIKDTPEYTQIAMSQVPPSYAIGDDEDDWWDGEECSFFLNEVLFDVLNDYAPNGYYFGAHEGDGSDFGYWEIIDTEIP